MNAITSAAPRQAEAAAKSALLQSLRARGQLRNGALASELNVGRQANRADIVLIDRRIRCFEVKSFKDTLSRIDQQVDAYSQCFDEVEVVVASCHLNAALSRLPQYIGLSEIRRTQRGIEVIQVRAASQSPMLRVSALLDLLPVSELRLLPAVDRSAIRRADLVAAAATVDVREIHAAVRRFLTSRFERATKEFLRRTSRRTILPADLEALRVWGRTPRPACPPPVHVFDRPDEDWLVFDHVGRSFGEMPDDVRELMHRLSQTKALPPEL